MDKLQVFLDQIHKEAVQEFPGNRVAQLAYEKTALRSIIEKELLFGRNAEDEIDALLARGQKYDAAQSKQRGAYAA